MESQDGKNESRQSTANLSSRESTADSSRIDTAQSEGITRFRGTLPAEIPIESLQKAERIAKEKKERREARKKERDGFRDQFDKGDGDDYKGENKGTGGSKSGAGIDYFAKDEYDVEVKHGPLGIKFQPIPGAIGGARVKTFTEGGYGDRGGVKVGETLIAVNTDVIVKEPYDSIIQKIKDARSGGKVLMLRFKRAK